MPNKFGPTLKPRNKVLCLKLPSRTSLCEFRNLPLPLSALHKLFRKMAVICGAQGSANQEGDTSGLCSMRLLSSRNAEYINRCLRFYKSAHTFIQLLSPCDSCGLTATDAPFHENVHTITTLSHVTRCGFILNCWKSNLNYVILGFLKWQKKLKPWFKNSIVTDKRNIPYYDSSLDQETRI